MIIQVDQEGSRAIQQLCDIALKSAGMQNFKPVNVILRSVRLLPTPEDIEQGTNHPKSSEKDSEKITETTGEKSEEPPKEVVVEEKVVEEKPKEEATE